MTDDALQEQTAEHEPLADPEPDSSLTDDADLLDPPPAESPTSATEPAGPPNWLRRLVLIAAIVAVVAAVVDGYAAVRRQSLESADGRQAAAVAAARQWVELFVTTTEETVVSRADDIAARTAEPLSDEAMNRIEPFLELLSDDGSGRPLQITSAAVERAGERAARPAPPADSTTVLVTTTARSGTLGHGVSLWLYVVEQEGIWKIADFGGAG